MNKSLIIGLAVGATAVTAAGAFAGYRMVTGPSGAEVVSVKALTAEVTELKRQVAELNRRGSANPS